MAFELHHINKFQRRQNYEHDPADRWVQNGLERYICEFRIKNMILNDLFHPYFASTHNNPP